MSNCPECGSQIEASVSFLHSLQRSNWIAGGFPRCRGRPFSISSDSHTAGAGCAAV